MSKRITEAEIFRYMALVGAFLLINFSDRFGRIYLLMLVADFIWWKTDKKVTLKTERVNKRTTSLSLALVGYVLFFMSNIVLQSIFSEGGGLQAVLASLSSTTPIFRDSQLLTLVGWGIFIPIVESRWFFGRIFEGLMDSFGGNLNSVKITQRTAIIILLVAAGFTLFHFTSKNLEVFPLMTTFVFGIISCWIVLKERQLMGTILFHVFVNMTAVLFTFRPALFASLGLI